MAALLILKARKSCHITPYLQELDWLPINEHIEEKILKITFQFQNGLCPSYLSNILNKKVHSRTLRSADGHILANPLLELRTVDGRSFSSVGPRLLNNLSVSLRNGSLVRATADPGT